MMQPHDILGVEPDADFESIRRAYLTLTRAAHPDAGGTREEFVQLHAAYEAMVDRLADGTTSHDERSAEEATAQRAQAKSFEGIKEETWERLAEEFAQDSMGRRRPESKSTTSFWREVILTFLCVAALATCLSYQAKCLEPAFWSFAFVITLGLLLYAGSLTAVLGKGLSSYRQTILWGTLAAALIILATQPLRNRHPRPQPVTSRDLVPTWWPIQSN